MRSSKDGNSSRDEAALADQARGGSAAGRVRGSPARWTVHRPSDMSAQLRLPELDVQLSSLLLSMEKPSLMSSRLVWLDWECAGAAPVVRCTACSIGHSLPLRHSLRWYSLQ